jgi:hypothetical protein
MVPTNATAKPVRRPVTTLDLIAENARVWEAAPVGAVIRMALRGAAEHSLSATASRSGRTWRSRCQCTRAWKAGGWIRWGERA